MTDAQPAGAAQQQQQQQGRDMEEAITALECAALPLPRHKASMHEMAEHLMRLFHQGWPNWSGTQAAGWLDALSALTRQDGVSPILLHGGVLAAMAMFAGKRTAKMDSHNLIVVLNNLLIDAPQQCANAMQQEPNVDNLALSITRAMKGGISSKRVAVTAVQLWLAHGPIESLGRANVPQSLATCIATSLRKLGSPEHDAALRSFSILVNHDPSFLSNGETAPEQLATVLLNVGIDRSLHEEMRREALRALALQAGTVTYNRSEEATSEEVTCMLNVLCNTGEPRTVACAAAAVLVPAFGAATPPLQGAALLRCMEQRRLLPVLVELIRRPDTEADDRCDVLLLLANIIDNELCEGATLEVGRLLVAASAVAAVVDMLKRLLAAKCSSEGQPTVAPIVGNNYGIIGNAGEFMPQPEELGKMINAAVLLAHNLLECDEAVQRQCNDFGLRQVLTSAEAHPELVALRQAQAEQEAEQQQLEQQRAETDRIRAEQEKQKQLEQQQRLIEQQLRAQQEQQARMLAEQQRLQQEQLRLAQEQAAAAVARQQAELQRQQDAAAAAAAPGAAAAPAAAPAPAAAVVAESVAGSAAVPPPAAADAPGAVDVSGVKRSREEDEEDAAREASKPKVEEAPAADAAAPPATEVATPAAEAAVPAPEAAAAAPEAAAPVAAEAASLAAVASDAAPAAQEAPVADGVQPCV